MANRGDMDTNELIQTFVFLDLETTGLEKPITCELCMIAVDRNGLLACNTSTVPRVQHKLLLCVNPRRSIGFHASQITGLFNDELENCAAWDKEIVEITSKFLSRLPKPICLLAHNGFMFDFPVLREEVERIGASLDLKIYCADTLHIIKAMESENREFGLREDTRRDICESPIGVGASMKPPGAPRKCRDKNLVDFKVNSVTPSLLTSENVRYRRDLNETPVVSREKQGAQGGRSVKRNLLLAFSQQENKKLCTVAGIVSRDGICNRDGINDNNNSAVVMNEGRTHADTEDCDSSDDDFMATVVEMERRGDGNKSDTLPGLIPSTGVSPGLSLAASVHACVAGEITPEKRTSEVRSPPKTPTKPPQPVAKNPPTNSRSLNDQFLVSAVERNCYGGHTKSPGLSTEFGPLSIGMHTDYDVRMDSGCDTPMNIGECSRRIEKTGTRSPVDVVVTDAINTISQATTPTHVLPNVSGQNISPSAKSYRLEDIYRRYFGVPPCNSHSAEDDCMSLLKIAVARSSDFCVMVDKQRVPLDSLTFRR